ncbi:MAG: protein kinase, partial [Deltaproteobacteria bacterium]|nr:protein kinase [Deltaproteobacteria bacterium]
MAHQSQGVAIPAGGVHGASHEVLGRLAVGGMAELYLARTTHDNGSQEVVVLKRILPHLAEDPEFVRMFRDEAFLAATLDHRHIVRVHDIGQDGEDYFFTMEYVHGENVRTIIKAAQKIDVTLPLEHVVQIGIGVCEGLHYAHEQLDEDGSPLKIVHRDVSPTNILVSYDGEVKIVDFGIAKAAAATHVTQAGMLKGKASYMSPEQCRAQPVDRRSDVFAIGILLYEMTTLTRLFRGDNELAVLHQILTGTIEPPSTRIDDYSAPLERIVLKALAEKPDDRYPTADAMREDLEKFAREQGLSPSIDSLGEYLRDLCGEKPLPWDEDEEEVPLALESADVSSTGTGATSMGNFEDEEDTQVNRRAPDLRTLIPGAPSAWTEGKDAPQQAAADGTAAKSEAGADSTDPPTNRRQAGAVPPAQTAPVPRRTEPRTPRVPPAPKLGQPAVGAATRPSPGRWSPPVEGATTPMKRPAAARKPLPPGPASRTGQTELPPQMNRPAPARPFTARSGRTLPGASGGLGGPLPPRSGRTLPSGTPAINARRPGVGTARAAAAQPGTQLPAPPGRNNPTGAPDRTVALGAGSRPVPAGARPGSTPPGAAASPPNARGPVPEAERTMPLLADQMRAAAMAGRAQTPPGRSPPPSAGATPAPASGAPPRSNSWTLPSRGAPQAPAATPASASGPIPAAGPTPASGPTPAAARREDVDEGARTLAM